MTGFLTFSQSSHNFGWSINDTISNKATIQISKFNTLTSVYSYFQIGKIKSTTANSNTDISP